MQIWRVYQRGLEHWLADLLQPVFDGLVEAGSVPRFVTRLRILEFTVDHEAPYFTNMRRRTSRKVGGCRVGGVGGRGERVTEDALDYTCTDAPLASCWAVWTTEAAGSIILYSTYRTVG